MNHKVIINKRYYPEAVFDPAVEPIITPYEPPRWYSGYGLNDYYPYYPSVLTHNYPFGGYYGGYGAYGGSYTNDKEVIEIEGAGNIENFADYEKPDNLSEKLLIVLIILLFVYVVLQE